MNDRIFPAPSTISEAAQKWLDFRGPAVSYPAQDDTESWLSMIAMMDGYIVQQFMGRDLPVTIEDREVAHVPVYVARPAGILESPDEPIYLNFHGGGLLTGGGAACRAGSGVAALTAQLTTWSVDYRMPPLHPFPAALDDAFAVYSAVIKERDPARIVVGGGSAGGNIVAALMLRAKDAGLPLPAALVLDTPELDLTESGDTFQVLDGVDNILSSLHDVNVLYADGADLSDPYLSPLFGDVTGFPPTFLQSGTRDMFLSNTVLMHRKLRNAGVDAELHVFEAMPHGGFGGSTPEDQDKAAEQRRFMAKHLPAAS